MGNRSKKKSKRYSVAKAKAKAPTSQQGSSPGSSSSNSSQSEAHHYPRWIIRKFSHTGGPGNEKINCFNLRTGTLGTLPVATAYLVSDPLRDPTSPTIESEYSNLERNASRVVQAILSSTTNRAKNTCELTWQSLSTLLKYLYITGCYRQSVGAAFLSNDHPDKVPMLELINEFLQRHAGTIEPDVWRHVVRYYLRTPHIDILKNGKEAKVAMMTDMFCSFSTKDFETKPISLDLLHWEALAYCAQMERFYLSIWVAAPGEEFVITSTTFGLYEGLMEPFGQMHRFYVVSPTVVLVMCNVCLKPGPPLEGAISMVLDVPHEAAEVKTNANNKNDMFTFKVQRLSAEQTHTINAIILSTHDPATKGHCMVTFRSNTAAANTLQAFMQNESVKWAKREPYRPLLDQLQKKFYLPPKPFKLIPPPVVHLRDAYMKKVFKQYETIPAVGRWWETHMETYDMLHSGEATPERFGWYHTNEQRIIESAKPIFTYARGSAPDRPFTLVRRVHDVASGLHIRGISSLLLMEGVDVREIKIFRQQYVIAVIKWLYEYNPVAAYALSQWTDPQGPWYCDVVEFTDVRYISGGLVEDEIENDPFFLKYKTSRYPADGKLWSTHITLYDQLQKCPPKTLDYYQAFEKAAIKAATFILENHSSIPAGSRRASVGARPARLVREMDDETALNVFGYVRSILTGGGFKIIQGPIFKEQVVLGVLMWLLDNWRVAFDEMEIFLTGGMCIKEGRGVDQPLDCSWFEGGKRLRAFELS